MKILLPQTFYRLFVFSLLFYCFGISYGQTIGIYESYLILNSNGAGNTFYDLDAATANVDFNGANLGSFSPAGSLVLAGGQNKTFKCDGGNVTGGNVFYRVYLTSAAPGSFSSGIAMSFVSNDAGGCGGNQTWQVNNNTTNVLNGLTVAGTYYLEVYTNATGTPDTVFSSNGGANFKATFTLTAGGVYNFTSGTGAAANNTTGCTLSTMTSVNNNGTVTAISTGSASSGYTGASGTNNIGNATPGGALNTSTSGYFQFTITPPAGGIVTVNSISFGSRGSGTAPTNYAIRTSKDNYAANVAAGTLSTSSTWALVTPTLTSFSSDAGTPVIVRIYGHSGTGASANTIVWRLDDIIFNSTLSFSPILTPSPTSLTFGSQNVLTNSTSQSFNLSGTNLTGAPGNITVTAPNTSFQVSNDNSTWGASTTIAYASATLASTPVYVRFVPQSSGAKSGNITFSGGGVGVSPTVALSGTGVLPAPVATAATSINTTSFSAHWNAVTGASSGYLLDVSTSSTFGTMTPSNLTEGFAGGITPPTDWTFTAIGGTYTTAGNYGASSPALQMDATADRVQTATLSGVATQMSFWIKGNATDAASALLVEGYNGTSWVTIQNITSSLPTTGTTYTYNSGTSPALPANIVQFRYTYTKSAGNLAFDDVSINYNLVVPSYVSGYQAKPVSGQSTVASSVTGLNPDTQYYYRLRATDGTPSAYSNIMSAKTKPTSVTWNGTAWSNVTGPDADIEAVIAGVYSTTTHGVFTAKQLTVSSGSLTVNSGTTITVVTGLINSLTAADVVVENNGNLMQGGTTNVNSGAITVKRNSSALKRLDYTLWSSPVAGQQLLSFSPLTLVGRFYTYNTLTNLYDSVDPSATSFATAKGYLIRVPNDHPTTATIWNGSFAGVPNNGSYTFSMVDGGAGNRFNLVGNPYASPLDAVSFVSESTNASNITGALYFWRKTNNAANPSYCTWTLAGFVSNGEAQVVNPNDVIQTGQGFFVEGTGSGTDLHFDNTMRIDDHANQFFRASSVVEKHRIWLNVTDATGVFSQAMVGYMTNATNGVDAALDGKYINDGAVALSSIIGAERYAIQARALPFDSSDVVPLQFKTTAAGTFVISIDHVDGLFAANGQTVYLKDYTTNTVHNLTAGAYTFVSTAGTFDARFEIVYQQSLSVNNQNFSINQVVSYVDSGTLNVYTNNSVVIDSITIYDISGRKIIEKRNINASSTSLKVNINNQIVLLKIVSREGIQITKKVIL